MRVRLPALLLVTAGCAAASSPPGPASGGARAPYDNPPVGSDRVEVPLDLAAARGILAVLSRPAFDVAAAGSLQSLPAVQAAIRGSGRPPEVFERDLAAAFDEQARVTLFDFRKVRDERARWEGLLATIQSNESELTKLASNRARALLPADHPVSIRVPIDLTFGLAGLADHIVIPPAEAGGGAVVIDLSRALSDVEGSPPAEQIKHLSRLMAGQAFRQAWRTYRAESPAWRAHEAALGQLEPLLRAVAEAGPAGLYAFDENFFPLSVWLKEPMKSSIDDVNRIADHLVSTEGDLDARVELAAAIRRPEFAVQVAGPAGAFLSDGIIQTSGMEAYRAALSGGPRAFFESYDRAARQKGRALIPLSKTILNRLAGVASPPPPPRPTRKPRS